MTNPSKDELSRAMTIGASARSERKAKSSKANGKLGGAPRRYPQCAGAKYHKFFDDRCLYCKKTRRALGVAKQPWKRKAQAPEQPPPPHAAAMLPGEFVVIDGVMYRR